jgi:hypothetical protein
VPGSRGGECAVPGGHMTEPWTSEEEQAIRHTVEMGYGHPPWKNDDMIRFFATLDAERARLVCFQAARDAAYETYNDQVVTLKADLKACAEALRDGWHIGFFVDSVAKKAIDALARPGTQEALRGD